MTLISRAYLMFSVNIAGDYTSLIFGQALLKIVHKLYDPQVIHS